MAQPPTTTAALLTLALGALATADTIYVDGVCGDDTWSGASSVCRDDDGPLNTIQAAIDLAAGGDDVIVAAGVYPERIDLLGKAVHLRSAAGADATTIDGGGGVRPVVTCGSGEMADTVIEGFTITGGGGWRNDGSSPTIVACIFFGNTAAQGGAMHNCVASPTVVQCSFIDNAAEHGGAMYNTGGDDPVVIASRFTGNVATHSGGAIRNEGAGVVLAGCVFFDNQATDRGGAVSSAHAGSGLVVPINCAFAANSAAFGGALHNETTSSAATNCSFVANVATIEGGGMYSELISHPTARNSIFWGNEGGEIDVDTTSITHVHYCDVAGGFIGPGNIDADPQCIDAASGDLRLRAGSPCIDAADIDVLPADAYDLDGDGDTSEPVPLDADGLPRFVDDPATDDTGVGLVDIGAYEFQPVPCDGDVDGSGEVGFSDLLLIIVSWGPCPGCPADLDGDGDVGNIDLITVLAHWGDCPG